MNMVGQFPRCLSQPFVILLETVKRSSVRKILYYVVIDVTDQDVKDIKDDCNHETYKLVHIRLKDGGS